MMNIKHLLIITPSFPKDEFDEIVIPPLHLYLKSLLEQNPELKISIVSIHYPFTNCEYQLFETKVFPFNAKNGRVFKRPFIWKKVLDKIKVINKEQQIDIVHSFWLNETALLGQISKKKYNIPHICTLMGQDVLPSNRYLKFFNVDKMNLIALSDFQRKEFRRICPNANPQIIPWGIIKDEIPKKLIKKRTIDLICVSSLIPLKRVHLFIDLVGDLLPIFPGLKAEIIGGGVLFDKLKLRVVNLGLEDNIFFTNTLSRKDCLKKMNNSKILIHTSSYESQGYVINEALANGCNVVAMSKGVISSKLNKKLSIVDNYETLKEASLILLNEKKNEWSSEVPFDMELTVKKYLNIYVNLANNK